MGHIHHRKEIAIVILLAIFILLLVWFLQWRKLNNDKSNGYQINFKGNFTQEKADALRNLVRSM